MSFVKKKFIALSAFIVVFILSIVFFALNIPLETKAEESGNGYEYPQVTELTLPTILSDGMVLQRDQKIHLWGLTKAGRTITASVAKTSAPDVIVREGNAVADGNGRFDIYISEGVSASFDSYIITIDDGNSSIAIKDVLFGEVWLTSGQSNMELQLQYIIDGPKFIREACADSAYANLRLYLEPTMPNGKSLGGDYEYLPQFDLPGSRWGKANIKDDVKISSAVSYICAQQMFKQLNEDAEVPVAIINTALGATSIEAWMSRDSIDNTTEVVSWLKNIKRNYVSKQDWNKSGGNNYNQMTAMFNEKIAPIAGYSIKGLLWYQGENNMGDQPAADFYSKALPALVEDWSLNWWGYDKPFYCAYIHLNQMEYNYKPDSIPQFLEGLSTAWSENREYMMQVPIYDLPLTWNYGSFLYKSPIHPLDKVPVGERAARIILGNVYGLYENSLPATYKSMEVRDGSVYVTFENTAGALHAKNDMPIRGFTVCGADRKFVAADAEVVDADTVRVWSSDVSEPVAVTYAYTCFNYSCNLYNSIDLPVIPFRSDRISSTYYHSKDWMFADAIELWRDDGLPVTDVNAGSVRKVWQTNPIGKSYASSVSEVAGKNGGAICLSYGTDGGRCGVVGPENRVNGLNNMIFGGFENFSGLEINLLNNDAREKTFSLLIKTFNDEVYTLPLAKDLSAKASLAVSDEWQTYSFCLNYMINEEGVYVDDVKKIIADGSISAFEIRVFDDVAGSIAIDEIRLRRQSALVNGTIADNFASEGNYVNAGGTGVFAGVDGLVGRTVLLLSDEGAASAEYDVKGIVSAEIRALSAEGSFAVLENKEVRPFRGNLSAGSKLVSAHIGDDGLRYVYANDTWYVWNKGKDAFVIPNGKLPQKFTPVVGAQVYVDGGWMDVDCKLSNVVPLANYVEESYVLDIPNDAEKLRVYFDAEWREQNETGNTGMINERAKLFALSSLTVFSATENADQSAPNIIAYSGKSAYVVGERVELFVAAYDAESYAEDINVVIKVINGDQTTELEEFSFIFANACTIEVTATDADGRTSVKSFELSETLPKKDEPDNSSGGELDQSSQDFVLDSGSIGIICLSFIAVFIIAVVVVLIIRVKRSPRREN